MKGKALQYLELAHFIIYDLVQSDYILNVDKDKLSKIKEALKEVRKEVLNMKFEGKEK